MSERGQMAPRESYNSLKEQEKLATSASREILAAEAEFGPQPQGFTSRCVPGRYSEVWLLFPAAWTHETCLEYQAARIRR